MMNRSMCKVGWISRALCLSGSFFISAAFAADRPIPPQGSWNFRGVYQTLQISEYESVSLSTPEGLDRIEELRLEGYVCQRITSAWELCQKWIQALPEEIDRRLNNDVFEEMHARLGNEGIFFSHEIRGIEEMSSAPRLDVFRVTQAVDLQGLSLNGYNYYRSRSEDGRQWDKIEIADDFWLLVGDSSRSISVPLSYQYKMGIKTWTIWISADLSPSP